MVREIRVDWAGGYINTKILSTYTYMWIFPYKIREEGRYQLTYEHVPVQSSEKFQIVENNSKTSMCSSICFKVP